MSSPVRFPFGVTNTVKASAFGAYPAPSPLAVHEDFDDFNRFAAAEWTITRVGTTPTEALTDGDGGQLLLSTVASAASSTFLQKVGASFLPAVGKKLWLATRLAVSVATDTNFQVGLVLTDTTPLDATDGIYFIKSGNNTDVSLICRKDTTTGSTTTGTIAAVANATYIDLGFYYDGKRTVEAWVDGALADKLDLSADATAFLPDTVLRVSFGAQNVGSTARTATYDYIFAAQER